MERPPFLKCLLEAWQLNLEYDGWRALVPFWLLGAAGLGGWLAWSLPANFWDGSKPEVPIALMAGLLTFDGLTLALSWSSFAKILEIIGGGPFCAFLRRNRLLSRYLAVIGYVHVSQVMAITATSFAMFSPALMLEAWAMKLTFAASVACSIYAVRQGVAASSLMQDLVWQKATFDQAPPAQDHLQPAAEAQR